MNLERLARPSIWKLRPYQSARSLATEAEVFLDANESPVGELNRYPSPQPRALVEKFASLYGVDPSNVFVGRGSDEAIDTLTRAFCEPREDEILITPPTYGMYEVSADIQDVRVARVPLLRDENWRLDVESMITHLITDGSRTKLIYICSPNNPTGGVALEDDVRRVCEAAKDTSLVVIDEAYAEFSGASFVGLLKEYPHVVILRTLSKAWALAGLRCGVALGDPSLISLLQKVRAPYPLPQPVVDLAMSSLRDEKSMRERVAGILDERSRLVAGLRELSVVEEIFLSDSNFILARVKHAGAVMEAARASGILIRNRDSEVAGCVRITVGTPAENARLLAALGGLR